MVRAMVSMNGVQLLSPSASRTTWICGRSIMTSAISNRCSNSGSRRKFAVSTSTASAGSAVAAAFQPDVMKGDVAAGKHRNVDRALDHQIEAGDGADLRLHRLAQRVPVEEPGRSRSGRSAPRRATPRSASPGASFLGPSSMTYPSLVRSKSGWIEVRLSAGRLDVGWSLPKSAGRAPKSRRQPAQLDGFS